MCQGHEPQLHVATFSDIFDPRLQLPLASAYQHKLRPIVLGLGQRVSWGKGQAKTHNTYRSFVFNETCPQDVVVFVDAYDVMFQAGEEELLARFFELEARTGREIFYNAEPYCTSPRKADYPPCDTAWRYLNQGVSMGRSRAMRKLFKNPFPNTVGKDGRPMDIQVLHTDFYLDNQDLVMVDTHCELMQVILSLREFPLTSQIPRNLPQEVMALSLSGGRVHNLGTNTTPLVLHFIGPGHWPEAGDPTRTGTCLLYEVARITNPSLLLMEERAFTKVNSQYFGQPPWKPFCTFWVSPFDYAGYRLGHIGDRAISWYFNDPSVPAVELLLATCLLLAALAPCRSCIRQRMRSGKVEYSEAKEV